jgi:hypothetical protein
MRDDFDWSGRRPVYSSRGSGRGSGKTTYSTQKRPRYWTGETLVDQLHPRSKAQKKGRGSGRTTRASRRRAIDLGNL